ncbi:hypothetical protein LMG28727_06613 [Paraburkholderia kirstenboschensis]|nr:hypothetical protein LMG28727_06613 [Paraburkholderia kirstenboschensis]
MRVARPSRYSTRTCQVDSADLIKSGPWFHVNESAAVKPQSSRQSSRERRRWCTETTPKRRARRLPLDARQFVKGFLSGFMDNGPLFRHPLAAAAGFALGADFERTQNGSGQCFGGECSDEFFCGDTARNIGRPADPPLMLAVPHADRYLRTADERLYVVPPRAARTSGNVDLRPHACAHPDRSSDHAVA